MPLGQPLDDGRIRSISIGFIQCNLLRNARISGGSVLLLSLEPGWGERILQVRMNGQKRCLRSVNPSRLSERLLENRVIRSRTHGKRMLFELDRRLWLGIHLGMTGSLLIRPSEADLEKHDHLVLETHVGWFSTTRDNSEESKVSKAILCLNFDSASCRSSPFRKSSISIIFGSLSRGVQSNH